MWLTIWGFLNSKCHQRKWRSPLSTAHSCSWYRSYSEYNSEKCERNSPIRDREWRHFSGTFSASRLHDCLPSLTCTHTLAQRQWPTVRRAEAARDGRAGGGWQTGESETAVGGEKQIKKRRHQVGGSTHRLLPLFCPLLIRYWPAVFVCRPCGSDWPPMTSLRLIGPDRRSLGFTCSFSL